MSNLAEIPVRRKVPKLIMYMFGMLGMWTTFIGIRLIIPEVSLILFISIAIAVWLVLGIAIAIFIVIADEKPQHENKRIRRIIFGFVRYVGAGASFALLMVGLNQFS